MEVPMARQQKMNQQKAVEQTALAVQTAARVIHVSDAPHMVNMFTLCLIEACSA